MNMSTKSQTIFAVCFGLFLAVVVTVSLLFADKLPHATLPEGITGGYLFSFNVECVDESGKILKTQKYLLKKYMKKIRREVNFSSLFLPFSHRVSYKS